jgi:clathrin heavy chain
MAPLRRPITADSALMAPSSKRIALKAAVAGAPGDSLQVFDLDTKAKVASFQIADPVVFWKWTGPASLGLVTATAVYAWDVGAVPAPDPVKVFDRAPALEATQIISYRTTPDGKWCALVGIAPGAADRPALVRGVLQLWSVDARRSQVLEAHAAAFASVTPAGGGAPVPVIAFAQKTAAACKLHIVQLGAPAGAAPLKKAAELFFPP